mgnify:CR=1 FL=1
MGWKSDKDGNHFNGKKTRRDVSEPDNNDFNERVNEDNEKFAEKVRMEYEQGFSEDVDSVADKVEAEIKAYGNELALSSGIQNPGLHYLIGTIDHMGWNVNLELVNVDWSYIYQQKGEKGIKKELDEIKQRDLETALYWVDKDFGYDEPERRPSNEGERIGQKLWEVMAVQPKDEELGKYETREQDYARSKQVVKDVIEKSFDLAYDKLPRYKR